MRNPRIKAKILKSYNPRTIFIITLGTLLIAAAYYFFFRPMHFVTGGITGLANIIRSAAGMKNDAIITLIGNLVILLFGLYILGWRFFVKTLYASLLLPFFIFLFEKIINNDVLFTTVLKLPISDTASPNIFSYLITTIFGALVSGIGLGMVFSVGTTTGGTDILQKSEAKYLKLPVSAAIYLTDGVIVLMSAIIFPLLNVLFSILTVLLIGQVVDKVILMGSKGYTILIITNEFAKIKTQIITKLNRGLTKIDVSGGYTNHHKQLIICTVSRKEIFLIKNIVSQIDPKAFSLIMETHEVLGDGFKRSGLSE